jgi:Fe-S-cluster containining protein
MSDGTKVARNEPCPCGSGKKFKKCCGAPIQPSDQENEYASYLNSNFELNKEIAYTGLIGQDRYRFCTDYIAYKPLIFEEIRKEQIDHVKARNETITCHKGCPSYCCSLHVEVTLPECEAIVFYLYQNQGVLNTFMRRYPEWWSTKKEQILEIKNITNAISGAVQLSMFQKVHKDAINDYYTNKPSPCPFLTNNLCLIYDVRPFLCAGMVVTHPIAQCHPSGNANSQRITSIPDSSIRNRISFYRSHIKNPYETRLTMPNTVYEILDSGFYYLSSFSDSDRLKYEVVRQPEVQQILHKNFGG